jgi:hypothetical protein
MLRTATRLSVVLFLMTATGLGVWQYRKYTTEQRQIAELQRQKQLLEQEKAQLQQVVTRLTAERRVAEIVVTDRRVDPSDGLTPLTTLLFVETTRDGAQLPPRSFTVRGEQVHIDGLVIEFPANAVQQADPLRGHSIILFEKIYGSSERPAMAQRVDSPGRMPELYQTVRPEISAFEQELWANFWRLAQDAALRQQKGVRLANGKGIYGPFEKDRLYTVTLDASGKMSLDDEPIKGAVGEALRQLSGADGR